MKSRVIPQNFKGKKRLFKNNVCHSERLVLSVAEVSEESHIDKNYENLKQVQVDKG